jgi:hypothetical protein
MNTITLWHGGRNLEYSYRENQSSSKGKWEHGPGLYLTTHYDTAYQYSKGGGKTYHVEIEEGTDIKDVMIDISVVNQFVLKHTIKSKAKNLLDDLYSSMHRTNTQPKIHAEYVLNLIFNNESISHSKTHLLTEFLVENGVDYGKVTRFKGRDETVLVIYNKNKIKSVKPIPAKNVDLSQWEVPFVFNKKNNPKI